MGLDAQRRRAQGPGEELGASDSSRRERAAEEVIGFSRISDLGELQLPAQSCSRLSSTSITISQNCWRTRTQREPSVRPFVGVARGVQLIIYFDMLLAASFDFSFSVQFFGASCLPFPNS